MPLCDPRGQVRRISAWWYLLPAYGLLVGAYLLFISWSQPVLDHYGFRQAQTAISAYWIAKGGPFWSYMTPVVGYPWSLPFEFPLYQYLVGKLADGATVSSIDRAGRLVSLAFFIGASWLTHQIVVMRTGDRRAAVLCAGTLLASPLMLFWSRAVMIESTALFFGIAFVWSMAKAAQSTNLSWAVLATITACIAALVKITTFFGFAIFVAGALLIEFARAGWPLPRRVLATAVVAGVAVVLSIVSLELWLAHSDQLKAQSLWGVNLASSRMGHWNYGSWSQRIDPSFWIEVVFVRSGSDGLGSPWLLPLAAIAVLVKRSTRAVGLLLLASYLAPFLVFTNLHQVHDYYQYANVVFATTLLALAINNIAGLPGWKGYIAAALVLAVCILSWLHLSNRYMPRIKQDVGRDLSIAALVKDTSSADSAVLVFGMDWDSSMPYYAERRALMMPDWLPMQPFQDLAASNAAFGGLPVGAVVLCPNHIADDPEKAQAYSLVVQRYVAGLTKRSFAGCEIFSGAFQTDPEPMTNCRKLVAVLALAPVVVGCDRSDALPDPSKIEAPGAVGHEDASPRKDPIDAGRLEAGLAMMAPRVVEKHDGFAPVEVKTGSRYFLHPDSDKTASIAFDVTSLRKLTLAPYMEDFSSVKDCTTISDAGVVNVSWRLDDRPLSQFIVDRSYAEVVQVDLEGASRLTIEVDQGNGVPWCDWMSMGFVDVVPK